MKKIIAAGLLTVIAANVITGCVPETETSESVTETEEERLMSLKSGNMKKSKKIFPTTE